ncbi:MAG: hypothetical protein BMS9Abin12_0883 [Acidimicrobiia bacterium]|nr:MAG: hypothetical protein BMS9Abin12_0883 [Acidimicrobiia bacterium]
MSLIVNEIADTPEAIAATVEGSTAQARDASAPLVIPMSAGEFTLSATLRSFE